MGLIVVVPGVPWQQPTWGARASKDGHLSKANTYRTGSRLTHTESQLILT